MRTLKKSLALVLALVMVLGLGVVGASADNKLDDYTDAKDIGDAYVEAVGVMTGLEIVDGMTETTIDPTATYTREQAAKIIAYMVLGKAAADSLTCTVAPFDDVAADRWSAGYISFCVEQGIIDGMTDTTFEPTGTLTGFQWAKMLLSAVGFNANGEFTGDSWSLNTARVAHSVGLFTGDAAGADHVALQRQQAMLYAFNTLTVVKQVVWSEALGDYIYKYGEFADRYTGEGTLGETVFNLYSVEGIVTRNEGMGADYTYVSSDYNGNKVLAKVSADTDAFMLYHGARIWYVANGKDTSKGTSVYVNDLAKVTTLECPSDSARSELVKGIDKDDITAEEIGNGTNYYEYALIDNSNVDLPALTDDYATVNYKFELGELGPRSETKDTTVIDDNGAIKNDDIWTDISDLGRRDTIIYLQAGTEYYVYANSVTSGNVAKVTSKGVVTLTDGTELAPSVFNTTLAASVAELKSVLDDLGAHSTPAYTFYLDTHGHWYAMTNDPYLTVAYYTGAYRPETFEDTWNVDVEWIAQFVDVATGEEELVPVTANWKKNNKVGGYYDITDELYGDAVYEPVEVPADKMDNYGEYGFVNELVVKSNTDEAYNLIYNPDTVVFYIAEGSGNNLKVHKYVGNDELLAAYGTESRPSDTVTLNHVCVVINKASVGYNKSVTVIFAYDGIASAEGGTVFLPYGGTTWTTATDHYVSYTDDVYVNGSAATEDDFRVRNDKVDISKLTPGFYRYTVDNDGYVIDMTKLHTVNESASDAILEGVDGYWKLDEYVVNTDELKVVDVRKNADVTIDSITDLEDFFGDYAYNPEHPVNICYFVENNKVTLIYVVDANKVAPEVKVTAENLDTTLADVYASKMDAWGENESVTVTIKMKGDKTFNAASYHLTYNVDGGNPVTESSLSVSNSNTITFNVTVPGSDSVITITDFGSNS